MVPLPRLVSHDVAIRGLNIKQNELRAPIHRITRNFIVKTNLDRIAIPNGLSK
jgi:hypothetical protein